MRSLRPVSRTSHPSSASVQYVDAIYGPVHLDESVLLDLMASAALRRLQGVTRHGITALSGITPPSTVPTVPTEKQ